MKLPLIRREFTFGLPGRELLTITHTGGQPGDRAEERAQVLAALYAVGVDLDREVAAAGARRDAYDDQLRAMVGQRLGRQAPALGNGAQRDDVSVLMEEHSDLYVGRPR